jgi:hypothetical protein
MQTQISELLKRARAFTDGRAKPKGKIPLDPLIANSPSIKKAIAGMMSERGATREEAEDVLMRAHNLGEILTVEELAGRLKGKRQSNHTWLMDLPANLPREICRMSRNRD